MIATIVAVGILLITAIGIADSALQWRAIRRLQRHTPYDDPQ